MMKPCRFGPLLALISTLLQTSAAQFFMKTLYEMLGLAECAMLVLGELHHQERLSGEKLFNYVDPQFGWWGFCSHEKALLVPELVISTLFSAKLFSDEKSRLAYNHQSQRLKVLPTRETKVPRYWWENWIGWPYPSRIFQVLWNSSSEPLLAGHEGW